MDYRSQVFQKPNALPHLSFFLYIDNIVVFILKNILTVLFSAIAQSARIGSAPILATIPFVCPLRDNPQMQKGGS